MQLFWEIFGYVGTGLVILSMMMTSVQKLRLVNLSGSIVSMIYAIVVHTYPVVVLNAALAIINIIQLIRMSRKRDYCILSLAPHDPTLLHYLSANAEDLSIFFPTFREDLTTATVGALIFHENEIVGILVGKNEGDRLHILIDYTSPRYRDFSVAAFLLPHLKQEGYTTLTAKSHEKKHEAYLEKLGFTPLGDAMTKTL